MDSSYIFRDRIAWNTDGNHLGELRRKVRRDSEIPEQLSGGGWEGAFTGTGWPERDTGDCAHVCVYMCMHVCVCVFRWGQVVHQVIFF